jgi:hypothetical protein
MENENKIRGRPKKELKDDVKRNLQIRQHNYYVNYKNKKKQTTKPEPQEVPVASTLHESLNNIVKIIDGIKASLNQ